MSHWYILETFDQKLRDIIRSIHPFDGKTALRIGDFRQIILVVRAGDQSQILNACFKLSSIYPLSKVIHLSENIRRSSLQSDIHADPASFQFHSFFSILAKVGFNTQALL